RSLFHETLLMTQVRKASAAAPIPGALSRPPLIVRFHSIQSHPIRHTRNTFSFVSVRAGYLALHLPDLWKRYSVQGLKPGPRVGQIVEIGRPSQAVLNERPCRFKEVRHILHGLELL